MRSIMPSRNCSIISAPVVGHQVVKPVLKVLVRVCFCHAHGLQVGGERDVAAEGGEGK